MLFFVSLKDIVIASHSQCMCSGIMGTAILAFLCATELDQVSYHNNQCYCQKPICKYCYYDWGIQIWLSLVIFERLDSKLMP